MEFTKALETLSIFFDKYGYITIFLGSLIEITPMGWAVPGGVILAAAGFFANGGQNISLIPVIVSGTIGAWLTFLLAYWTGKKTGMWLVTKLHQEKNADFAKKLLSRHGGVILTTSMLANMTRFWVAYIAGVERYDIKKFSLYSFIAAFGWSAIMTIIGYIAGYERGNVERVVGATGISGWLFLIIALYFVHRSIKHEYKHFKEDEPHDENSKTH